MWIVSIMNSDDFFTRFFRIIWKTQYILAIAVCPWYTLHHYRIFIFNCLSSLQISIDLLEIWHTSLFCYPSLNDKTAFDFEEREVGVSDSSVYTLHRYQISHGYGHWSYTYLLTGKSQIGIGQLIMASNRFKVVDFSHFVYAFKISLMTRKPVAKEPFLKMFQPMDSYTWFGFIFSAFVIGGFIFLRNLSKNLKENNWVKKNVPVLYIMCSD